MGTDLREQDESLWTLAAPPIVWAVHFLLAYCTAAIWCAKASSPDVSLSPVRLAIAVYTGVALAVIGALAWRGFKRHHHGEGSLPHDADTPEDRYRFLGFATLLLCGLSAVAILYEAVAVVLIGSCR